MHVDETMSSNNDTAVETSNQEKPRMKQSKCHGRRQDKVQTHVKFKGDFQETNRKEFFALHEGKWVKKSHFVGALDVIKDCVHRHLKQPHHLVLLPNKLGDPCAHPN